MLAFQATAGGLAVVIALVSYIPYIRDILKGTTKPHPVSWFVFALLMGITFSAQLITGAGPGAWVMGISAIAIFGIAIFAIVHGDVEVVWFDWACLAAALSGIVLWFATNDPLTAVVIVTITDVIATGPMFRKAYLKPYEETLSLFVLSTAKFVVGFFAFSSFNLTNALFPSAIIVSNVALISLLVYRRKQASAIVRDHLR